MIEPRRTTASATGPVHVPPRPEAPERRAERQSYEQYAATLANLHVEAALRPPELRFDGPAGPGGPQFERQAIARMDVLKLGSAEQTVDALATFLVNHAPDIARFGSSRAKAGLADLDRFLGLNATFAAMRLGRRS